MSALLLTYVFVMNAWVSEDAYISFRAVDNFVSGYGLTWNPGERVQAFTHPLWFFVMAGAHGLTSEMYLTSIAVSYLLLMTTLFILWRVYGRQGPGGTLLAMTLLLVSSKAFIDYSSSGLENVLSYVVAACFFPAFLKHTRNGITQRDLFLLYFIASLAFTTRQDTILLYAPALVLATVTAAREKRVRVWPPILLGLLPALAWEVFSILYYGFPFPNSAYAKINTGIPVSSLARQAGWYFLNSLRWDFLTLTAIMAGLLYAGFWGNARSRAVGAGILLYLLYIVRIGGDFMSGRFFAVPFFIAVLLLARIPLRRWGWIAVGAVTLAVLVIVPGAPLKSSRSYKQLGIDNHGIADERGFYFEYSGLLFYESGVYPNHPWFLSGLNLRKSQSPGAATRTVGYFGYAAGPQKSIIDVMGITDPLLARLPVADRHHWRIGHFQRDLPAGYAESVRQGRNIIEDPGLSRFYDKIQLITTGPIFGRERLKAILAMNTGRYDGELAGYAERAGLGN